MKNTEKEVLRFAKIKEAAHFLENARNLLDSIDDTDDIEKKPLIDICVKVNELAQEAFAKTQQ